MVLAFIAGMILAASQHEQAVPVYEEPSHRPVFTNSVVRVLDVVLVPHQMGHLHTHVDDQIGLTIVPGPLRTEAPGEGPDDAPPDHPGDVWFETYPKPATHRGMNLGDAPIHYLVVQFLKPLGSQSTAMLAPEPAGVVVFENSRVRVTRIDLDPGEATPAHTHAGGYVLGALSPGAIISTNDASGPEQQIAPGFVAWHEAGSKHVLRNAGREKIGLVEFEVKE